MEWERLAQTNPESVPGRSGLPTRSFSASTVTVKKLLLPQQNNSSDCGCFLLTYLEVRLPAPLFSAPRADPPVFNRSIS